MYIKSSRSIRNSERINMDKIVKYYPCYTDFNTEPAIMFISENRRTEWVYDSKESRDKELEQIDHVLKTQKLTV